MHEILSFPKRYYLWFYSKNWPRYDQTQESGVGSGLIFETITGKLLSERPVDICEETGRHLRKKPHNFFIFLSPQSLRTSHHWPLTNATHETTTIEARPTNPQLEHQAAAIVTFSRPPRDTQRATECAIVRRLTRNQCKAHFVSPRHEYVNWG